MSIVGRCRAVAGVWVLVWFATINAAPTIASWTQYQGNAAHSGYVNETVIPSAITMVWTKSSTQLQQYSLISGAVTDPQTVYLSGSLSGGKYQVLALDRLTGAKLWTQDFVPYASSGLSSPSVGNGKVYVHQWGHSGISGGNASQYPYVFGLNATTGKIEFATSHSGQWSSGSRPTVADTQVFAAGGYYGGLDGYDGQSGSRNWFAKVNQQYGWIPAADSQNVYVYMGPASSSPGPYTGTLYAFNRATGASAFTILNPADTHTLYNGTVFLGEQNDAVTLTYGKTITAFDLGSRTVRWRLAGNFSGAMAINGGSIFASNGIELDQLDETSGTTLAKWFAPAGQSLTGNLAVTDDLIFARTDLATYAINRSTMQPVWSTNTVGDLAIGDGLLLISNSTSITAFSLTPEPGWALIFGACGLGLWKRQRTNASSLTRKEEVVSDTA
jgi:hypothetical protein